MTAAVLALALLASPRLWAAPRVFYGVTLSEGSGRPATARVTFDARTAAQGGAIYACASLGEGDEAAVRLSEAVLVAGGGSGGRAGREAARRGVPALALRGARWEPGARLALESPRLGSPRVAGKASVRPAEGVETLVLQEGSVISVDPARQALIIPPEEEAADWLAAAQAARAYDGLRDPQALLNWVEAHPGLVAAQRLLAELARRAAAGDMPALDLARVHATAAAGLEPAEAARFKAFSASLAAGEAKRAASDLAEALEWASQASSRAAAERVASRARARAAAVEAAAKVLGPADLGAVRALAAAVERAASGVGAGAATWRLAAERAGAKAPEGARLDASWYRRFIEENRLRQPLERVAEDASLPLGLKSARLRALILQAPLSSSLAAALLEAVPGGERWTVAGEGERFEGVSRREVPERVRQVWAAAWDPAPFGRRRRAGGLHPEPSAAVEAGAGVPARALSRDPLRRAWQVVEAGGDQYWLERRSGRFARTPLLAGAQPTLSAAQLKSLGAALRAVEGWFGEPVEAEFLVEASSVRVLDARPVSGPPPLTLPR